ncbi:MAG: ABC transporter permease [Muribaculaceae bacterium]|nr:ABC transporter permease [Muribaculaceae bacterium]
MLALRIALRYLFAKKSHTAVNIISMISMAGIAVASMAMVCVLSVFNGFTDLAMERLSAVDPDLRVSPREGRVMTSSDSLAALIEGMTGVRMAAPVLEQRALAIVGDAQLPVTVKGVPEGYSAMTALSSLVVDGEMVDPSDTLYAAEGYARPMALMSVGVAINTGARPSLENLFSLTVPRRTGRINPALPFAAFLTDTLFVSGVYQTNEAEMDEDYVIVPLSVARRLFEYPSEATSIEVALAPGYDDGEVAKELRRLIGGDYEVADRLQQQESSFRMIQIEKWITFAMLMFVLVMASFNILSTMSMLIIEKEDNLQILSALGAPERMIRRIFLDEGMLITLIGGAIGIALGVVLTLLQQHFGLIALGGDHSQMSVVAYPCRLAFVDVVLTSVVVVAIGIVSGVVSSARIK